MEARAILKQVGIPATKMRQLIDLVRGKPVEALTILRFSPRPVAREVEKTLGLPFPTGSIKTKKIQWMPKISTSRLFMPTRVEI